VVQRSLAALEARAEWPLGGGSGHPLRLSGMPEVGPGVEWQLEDIGWLRRTFMRIGLIVNFDPLLTWVAFQRAEFAILKETGTPAARLF
jgi:hypothetical protein